MTSTMRLARHVPDGRTTAVEVAASRVVRLVTFGGFGPFRSEACMTVSAPDPLGRWIVRAAGHAGGAYRIQKGASVTNPPSPIEGPRTRTGFAAGWRAMLGLVAAVLPLCAPASADESLTWTNEGRPQFAFYHYIDFGSTTIGSHFTWPTFSPDPALPNVKGADLLLDSPNTTENICYEVSTIPPREFPGDNVMDTRLWHVSAVFDPSTGGFRSTYR